MGRYTKEIWIGRLSNHHGYNWHLKGIEEEDYEGRAELCDEFLNILRDVQAYYERIRDDVERELGKPTTIEDKNEEED